MFLGPEPRGLFSFWFLGPGPFVFPAGFGTFFGRELGGLWFASSGLVPALFVLIAAYLTPGLTGYSLIAAADAEATRLPFVAEFLSLAAMEFLAFSRLVPYLFVVLPKSLSFLRSRGLCSGFCTPWLFGLRFRDLLGLGLGLGLRFWFG